MSSVIWPVLSALMLTKCCCLLFVRIDSFLSRYTGDYEEMATKLKSSFLDLKERFVIMNHFD